MDSRVTMLCNRRNRSAMPASDQIILQKIETVCLQVIEDISKERPPELRFARRCNWNELIFDETVGLANPLNAPNTRVRFDNTRSVKKFATMLKIMNIVYSLIQENRFCTKRDIFYQYPDMHTCQSALDRIIDDIACMLYTPRWELHILATCKGLVAGGLQMEDHEGTCVDCKHTSSGVQIPAHSKDMQKTQTQAKFILVVEKDASFQKLMSYQFCEKMDAILITGKGFPDSGTRLLLKQLWEQHHLPIFILADADPHGLEIMAVYKFGSMNQAYENKHLAVPSIQWLGILPEDIERYNIPEYALIPMSERDYSKATALKKRPYFKYDEDVLSQIDLMIRTGKKAEIQCLDAISSSYLSEVYLPSRISLLLY